MLRNVNQHIARRIKEMWERTGVFPAIRLPQAGPLLEWIRRNVSQIPLREAVQTMAGRVWSMLGLPQQALVVANASLEARHGSGVLLQASLTYATGALALEKAREIADELKDQGARVVPIIPGVNDGLLRAHLERRERYDQVSNPEILTTTTPPAGRMRFFGAFPTRLTPAQLAGVAPLPGEVRFSLSSEDGPVARRRNPTLAFTPSPAFA